MEHLPIFIFEIVLCVFLAFAALAEILFRQIVNQQKKIKKLETELNYEMQQYDKLEKFVHSNTEMVSCMAELEPIWYEKDPKYLDSLCERMGNTLVRKMQETFNERMLERIKELVKQRYFHKFLHTDLMSLTTRLKVSVPIFRVDYDYIKISDAEDILR